jgi:hypothetical protein
MATVTPNFNFPVPQSTDLVKDGATAIAALGTSVDTQFVDLKGGTTGQVLAKASNTDLDYSWVTTDDANAIQNAIVDAKGDLIAASAADTPARLAVGNNGETLVADSSTSTGLRYQGSMAAGRNFVINGGFDIWQRGTSFAGANSNTYTADRWNMYFPTSPTNYTLSRQSVSDSTNLPFIQYCLRVQRTAGTATAGGTIGTSIEIVNSIPLAGKQIVLSYYARKGANYSESSSNMAYSLKSGTGSTDANGIYNTYTGQATVLSGQSTLTTTWQRFSYTASIASTATQLALSLDIGASGTAGAADFIEITGVQLEVGSVATQFSRAGATIQGELAACQRYYFRNAPIANGNAPIAMGWTGSTTSGNIFVAPPVTMRTTPTAVDFSSVGLVNSAGSGFAVSAVGISGESNNVYVKLDITSSGLTSGQQVVLRNTSLSAFLGLSAEL